MKKSFILVLVIFLLLTSCFTYKPLQKSVNPIYLERSYENESIAIVIQGEQQFLVKNEKTEKILMSVCNGFESVFKEDFPKYLTQYSNATSAYFSDFDSNLFIEKSYTTDDLSNKEIKFDVPKKEQIETELNGEIPELILILKDIEFIRSCSANFDYASSIIIKGYMLLWDNNKSEFISYGKFKTNKNIDFDCNFSKMDVDSCLKLLIQDVTNNSFLFNSEKAFSWDDIE